MVLHWQYASRLAGAMSVFFACPMVGSGVASGQFLGLSPEDVVESITPVIAIFGAFIPVMFLVALVQGAPRVKRPPGAAPVRRIPWTAYLPVILAILFMNLIVPRPSPFREAHFAYTLIGYALGGAFAYVVFIRWVWDQRRARG